MLQGSQSMGSKTICILRKKLQHNTFKRGLFPKRHSLSPEFNVQWNKNRYIEAQ